MEYIDVCPYCDKDIDIDEDKRKEYYNNIYNIIEGK